MLEFDWETTVQTLTAQARSGNEDTDLLIESVVASAWTLASTELAKQNRDKFYQARSALMVSLSLAESSFLRADVAHALARLTLMPDVAVVDSLIEAFRVWREDSYLAPELLHALAVLAERDALARSEVNRSLLRLTSNVDRYLLVRAAKVITHLEAIGIDTGARPKLSEWLESEDPAVESEMRQQIALLAFYDILLIEDLNGLESQLEACRVLFIRADLSDEQRADARIYLALIDLLLSFFGLGNKDNEGVAHIQNCSRKLKDELYNPHVRPWIGYSSPTEQMIEYRLFLVAESFDRIARRVGDARGWTEMTEALVEVAAALHLILQQDSSDIIEQGNRRADPRILETIASKVVVPRIGPLIDRAIERHRFEKIIQHFDETRSTSEYIPTLRRLLDAASRFEFLGKSSISAEELREMFEDAVQSPETLDFFLRRFPDARALLRESVTSTAPENPFNIGPVFIAFDYPNCFGNHPRVDETVRPLLSKAKERLGEKYPIKKWHHFVQVLVSVVQFILRIRDDLPPYTLCLEDGGKGQKASENDLQKHIFDRISDTYGRHALYEAGPIAGGRTDSGVQFDEMAIPMEFKAEFRNISREHISTDFLSQSDAYATERDGIAFLFVLDLRQVNSGANLQRRRANKKSGNVSPNDEFIKLYSLREGFWIDGYEVSSQLPHTNRNAIVICLVPGNRTKPSSMTDYSDRPKQT